jgi:8-oxo-dGTP diphosphatase
MSRAPAQPTAPLHVVAAVIRGADGRLLLSRRPAHVDQGDLWEFPGGKLQAGEGRVDGLARELAEELGIVIRRATPLMRVLHRYPARTVLLDGFVVDRWDGSPEGREGQQVRWFEPPELLGLDFPAANLPLVTAARLPRVCLVTPAPGPDPDTFLAGVAASLERGVRLVQLRAPALDDAAYAALAGRVLALCREAGARLILNAEPALSLALGADGTHLNSARLRQTRLRPVPRGHLLSAACHDADELLHARETGVDFVFVSPVLPTASHPAASPLGVAGLAALLAAAPPLPAYALGGVGAADLPDVVAAGCIGVAGIERIWAEQAPVDDASMAALLARPTGS